MPKKGPGKIHQPGKGPRRPKGKDVAPKQPGGFIRFIRSRLGLTLLLASIAIPATVYVARNSGESSQQSFESTEIDGLRFNFSRQWESIFSRKQIDKEKLKAILQTHMQKLKDFIDMPQNFSVNIMPANGGGDVALQLEYDTKKMEADDIFEITSITATNELHIDPDLLESSSALHELIHLARASGKTLVTHHGFEEGLAEYGEMKAYPMANGRKPDIYLFLDHFPELERMPLEDSAYGFREFSGKRESQLPGVVPLKHEIRRRAFARFLDDPARPERRHFIKKLQAAQQANPKSAWGIQDALQVGDQIDPEFGDWFNGEPAFKTAEERKVARVLREGNILHFLALEFKKLPKAKVSDPDLFSMNPFQDKMEIYLKLASGNELKFTIQAKPDGLVQKIDLASAIAQAGLNMDVIETVHVSFSSGEEIPVKALQL